MTYVERNREKVNAGYDAQFKTVGDTIMASDTYILLDKKEEKLRDRIDEALVRLRAEGFLTELSIKWDGEDFSIDPYKE